MVMRSSSSLFRDLESAKTTFEWMISVTGVGPSGLSSTKMTPRVLPCSYHPRMSESRDAEQTEDQTLLTRLPAWSFSSALRKSIRISRNGLRDLSALLRPRQINAPQRLSLGMDNSPAEVAACHDSERAPKI